MPIGLLLLSAACSGDGTATAEAASREVFTADGIDVQLGHGLVDYADDADVDLRALVSRELERIQRVLHAPKTTMTITLGGMVVQQTGVGGGTDRMNGHVTINVALRARPDFRKALLERVPVSMAHELNHTKRMLAAEQCWAAAATTLSEALVCEGLADAFARQIYPERRTPHSDALTEAQEARMWRRIAPKLHELLSLQGFFNWFTSGGRGGIPHWTGYTVGFHIVRSYLRTHPGTTAAEITLMDADELIANSGYDAR